MADEYKPTIHDFHDVMINLRDCITISRQSRAHEMVDWLAVLCRYFDYCELCPIKGDICQRTLVLGFKGEATVDECAYVCEMIEEKVDVACRG